MKNVLKFSGAIAFVLGLVAFILMMATNSVVYNDGTITGWYSGVSAIFAGGSYKIGVGGISGVVDFDGTLAWNALLAWIFILVAMIIVCLGVVLPLLKVKALDKFSGILNLVAIGLFVVGGVLLFFTLPVFGEANNFTSYDYFGLGAGWIIAGI